MVVAQLAFKKNDTDEIKGMGFPAFSRGSYAQDQGVQGKVIDYRVPILIDGISVCPGDLIFADDESVLIIPSQFEADAFGVM